MVAPVVPEEQVEMAVPAALPATAGTAAMERMAETEAVSSSLPSLSSHHRRWQAEMAVPVALVAVAAQWELPGPAVKMAPLEP
jgi:hypothetical protein